ncbi:S8 family serine peptidase [bacterium]|nr:S8 family serine peptidase [bacterium]
MKSVMLVCALAVLMLASWTLPVNATPALTEPVREMISDAAPDEFIRVAVIMEDRIDADYLMWLVKDVPRNDRSPIIWEELVLHAKLTQADILAYVEKQSQLGKVEFYRSIKTANAVQLRAFPEVIEELANRLDVDRIVDDRAYPVFPPPIEDDGPIHDELDEVVWSVDLIDAPEVWEDGWTGEDVLVAVIDSGVDYNHGDLADHMWDGGDEYPNHGYNFENDNNNPMDNNGHGTHCSGSICSDGTEGDTAGVAFNATLMACKVSLGINDAAQATVWAAHDFVVEQGVDVTSMSMGYITAWNPDRTVWRGQYEMLHAAGIINIVAAGNEAHTPPPESHRTPGNVPSPWRSPDEIEEGGRGGVITVGATTNQDQIAGFSSLGPVTWENIDEYWDYPLGDGHVGMISPDVSAPGDQVRSCMRGGGYTNMSGTSMATPHVAGLVCLLLSKAPNLEPEQIDEILQTTAIDLGDPGKDNVFGAGRIDCPAAMDEAITATGFLSGTVVDLETGLPLAGVSMETPNDDDYIFTTDENGEFDVEIIIGDYYLHLQHPGFNPITTDSFTIIENEELELFFEMTHPEFNSDTQEISLDALVDDQVATSLTLSNSGNGVLDYSFRVQFNEPELDEPWDVIGGFQLANAERRNRGVTWWNDEFWVCGSDNDDIGYNKLYRYSADGALLGEYNQPVANHSSAGFFEVTTDGEYLYGADRGMLYQMLFEGNAVELIDSWELSQNNVGYLAYDVDRNQFWVGDRLEDMVAGVDLNGNTLIEYDEPDGARGMGYYGDDPQGYTLYFICQDDMTTNITKMHPETGETMVVHTFPEYIDATGSDISNTYNPLVWSMMTVADGGNVDDIVIYEVALNARWIDIEPDRGSITAGNEQQVDITIFTDGFDPRIYSAWLRINHTAIEGNFIIPLEINVQGEILPPCDPYFVAVEPTGDPYSIVIDQALLDGEPLGRCDEIAVFDGDICVGVGRFEEDGQYPLPFPAWGENEEFELPGFTDGHPVDFRIWSAELQEEFAVEAIPLNNPDGIFGFGPYYLVQIDHNTGGAQQLTIPLQGNYFELISTNLTPPDLNAISVFNPIDNLVIVYQDDGGIFLPPFINTIGNVNVAEGYKLFCEAASELVISGTPVDVETEYTALAARWNWIGYPFDHPVNPEEALEHVGDNIAIVQNDDGQFWIPDFLNTIFDGMQPGEGYFIFVTEELTFQYQDGAVLASDPAVSLDNQMEGVEKTGQPWIVLAQLSDELLMQGASVLELYDSNILVGKAAIDESSLHELNNVTTLPVVTWAGSDEHNLTGFTNGHALDVVVRNEAGSKLAVMHNGNSIKLGDGPYGILSLESAALPTEFAVGQGYPNPFNPSITIPFALPEQGQVDIAVFDLLGREVFHASNTYEAGKHRFMYNADQSGQLDGSGVYFLQVRYHDQVKTQKILLLK